MSSYRERDRFRMLIIKPALYLLLIFAALILQFTLPPLFIWSVRPQLLIMAAAAIIFFGGPVMGGAAGFLCGALCDWISTYTVTFYTVTLMLLGIALGIFVEYGMRRTLLSAYFVAIIILVVSQTLFVTFFLLIFQRAGVWAFVYVATPEILYSLAFLPLFYFPAKSVYRRTLIKS